MHHLAWCGLSIVASIALSFIFRILVFRLWNDRQIRLHYDEFAANFVFVVVMMEISIISYAQHSPLFYFSAVWVFLFFKVLLFGAFELYANPLSFIDLFYSKNRTREFTFLNVLSIVVTQVAAALLGQYFAKSLWLLEDAVHVNAAEEACLATLSNTHVLYECFVVEMLGTFTCAVIDSMVVQSLKFISRPTVVWLVIYNFGHVTGTWMNPMLASTFTFRCEGQRSDWEHLLVYWLAPLIGLLLAWEVRYLYTHILSTKKSVEKKKKKDN